MTHPNAEALRKGYDAFEKGDMDTIRSLFTDDVVFHVPGKSQLAGDYKGPDEVLGLFGRMFEITQGTLKLDVHSILADDEHGAVLSTGYAQREGKTYEMKTVDVFHFMDGRVSECWGFVDDQYKDDELWG